MSKLIPFLGLLALSSQVLSQSCETFADCSYPNLCFGGICREQNSSDRCNNLSLCAPPLKCQYAGSTSLGRICIATRAAGETCGSYQCEDGYTCTEPSDADTTKLCVLGRLNNGDECEGKDRGCGKFSQCLPGESGVSVCTSRLPTGAACDSAQPYNACSHGHICKNNNCIRQVRGGSNCDDDVGPYCQGPPTLWKPAYYCEDISGRKRCVQRQSIGQECGAEKNLSCQPGDECIEGICGNKSGKIGALCDADTDCSDDLACDTASKRCSKKVGLGESCNLSRSSFPSFQVCVEGTCIGTTCRQENVGLGDKCETGFSSSALCPDDLACRKADGNQSGDAFPGDDVCVTLVDSGGSCDTSAFRACKTSSGSRAACKDGVCVASQIGQFRDKCGDKPEGGATGVTCFEGDDCGEGKLTCMDALGGGLSPRVGDNLFCGLKDQRPGELCNTGIKGTFQLSQCVDGATCDTEGVSGTGTCLLRVDEGQLCDFDGFVRCKFGSFCIGGVCMAEK